MTRRLGREVLERVAQPLAGGIYTADPERLSMHADDAALCRDGASLRQRDPRLRAAARKQRARIQQNGRHQRRALEPVPSLRNGISTLPEALARGSASRCGTGAEVVALARIDGGGTVVAGSRWRVVRGGVDLEPTR